VAGIVIPVDGASSVRCEFRKGSLTSPEHPGHTGGFFIITMI